MNTRLTTSSVGSGRLGVKWSRAVFRNPRSVDQILPVRTRNIKLFLLFTVSHDYELFIPELNNHDVQELWFQQDGATCHTARATIDLLKDTFGDRLISRLGPVNWPPRSCDLTPLDYFLWGYVKSLVYADKPQTLDHLEDNIRRVIADMRPQMLEKVIENWTSRLDYIRASRGNPMPEIIFKIEDRSIHRMAGEHSASTAEITVFSDIRVTVNSDKSIVRETSLNQTPCCLRPLALNH
ncbi:putative LOC100569746 [Trichonephila clavipes]|nr:putative LOC100569746 [Trichonephila clavipes]